MRSPWGHESRARPLSRPLRDGHTPETSLAGEGVCDVQAALPVTTFPGASGHRHCADVQPLTRPLQRGLSLSWGVRQGQTDVVAAAVGHNRRLSAARDTAGSTRCPVPGTGSSVEKLRQGWKASAAVRLWPLAASANSLLAL